MTSLPLKISTSRKALVAAALLLALANSPFGPAQVDAPASRPAAAEKPGSLAASHRLRIASWNMLNLFDNVDQPEKPDEGTPPKSFDEMMLLARAIEEMDADVLGVQEVENRFILEQLNRCLKQPYPFVELIEGNDHRGIDVGILSRVPVLSSASHRHRPLAGDHRFSRDFPLFRLRVAKGQEVAIGVCHLKSKRGKKSESDAWRAAEARGISQIVAEHRKREPNVPVIIMGDFNDYRDAKTLESIFASMKDLTTTIPLERRHSFTFRNEPEQIDFMFGAGAPKVHRAAIPQRIDSPSDHQPVIVDFALTAEVSRVPVARGSVATVTAPKRVTLSATDLKGLRRHFLKEAEVSGTVRKVYRSRSGAISLNFHEDHRKALIGYVPRNAVSRLKIADLDSLIGRKVKLRGPISEHRGKLQIQVTRRTQLELL